MAAAPLLPARTALRVEANIFRARSRFFAASTQVPLRGPSILDGVDAATRRDGLALGAAQDQDGTHAWPAAAFGAFSPRRSPTE
jgi:hypothetical protein